MYVIVYPSLDLSDDEDTEKNSRGGKRKVDEAWNPKARVGHVTPKTDRPCREGAKKQSVEKGLEAAAAKRAGLPVSLNLCCILVISSIKVNCIISVLINSL